MKQSQDKKLLAKGDKEGVTVHSQDNTQSFWPVGDPLTSPQSWEVEGPCPLIPRRQVGNKIFTAMPLVGCTSTLI